jgi:CubicO group peptidase (beta-lactamase class C family)
MEAEGFADARFTPVRDCFAEVVRAQPGTGAGLVAWCDGQLVADPWGGHADRGRRRRWEASSLVQPCSVSKPFVAVCALRPAGHQWPSSQPPVACGMLSGWRGRSVR